MDKSQLCIRISILVLSAVSLAGCAANKPGFVAQSWSDNFRELRVVPIFPPREDVQVGDIYALAVNNQVEEPRLVDSYGNPIIGLWVASLELGQQINSFYNSRPEFPATPIEAQPNQDGTVKTNLGIAPEARSNGIFLSGTGDRLRSVGFPGFLSARVTGAELGALIPAELLAYKAGVSTRNARAATVSVPFAESYGLPAGKVIVAFENASLDIPGKSQASYMTWQKFFGMTPRYVDLTIITEVFYARTFDVALESTSETGFSAGIPLTSETAKEYVANKAEENETKVGGGTATAGSGNGGKNSAVGGAEATASSGNATAKSIEERNSAGEAAIGRAQSAVTKYPGFSIQVFSSSRGDVALRRTFYRPIAIGYRGIRLRYAINADGKQTLANVDVIGPTRTISEVGPFKLDSFKLDSLQK